MATFVTNREFMMVLNHVCLCLAFKQGQAKRVAKLHKGVGCRAIIATTKAPEPEGKALNLEVDLLSNL